MTNEKPTEEEIKEYEERIKNDPLLQELLKLGNTSDMINRKILDHIYHLHQEINSIKDFLTKKDDSNE